MNNKDLIIITVTSFILSIVLNVGFDVNFPIFHGFCLLLIIMFSVYYFYWLIKVDIYKQKEMIALKAKEKKYFEQKDYLGATKTIEKIIKIYKERANLSIFDSGYYKKMVRLYENLMKQYEYANYLKTQVKKYKS